MQKFFINKNQILENKIELTEEAVNHIKNVLRLKINEKIEVCNIEDSSNYLCEIFEISKEKIICNIIEKINDSTESNIYLNIIQALPKSDKMEWIIEKCTEIGVSEFTPLKMERCVVKIEDSKQEAKKLQRWRKIAESAAMQSKRDIVPIVNNIIKFDDLKEFIKDYDYIYVAYENEKENTLKKELEKIRTNQNEKKRIAVIIGPEGGISDDEIQKLHLFGFPIITLGKRILRTETAPIVISSIIMYEL